MIPNAMSPGQLTATPPAMVGLARAASGCPAASEPGQGATVSACAPAGLLRFVGPRRRLVIMLTEVVAFAPVAAMVIHESGPDTGLGDGSAAEQR